MKTIICLVMCFYAVFQNISNAAENALIESEERRKLYERSKLSPIASGLSLSNEDKMIVTVAARNLARYRHVCLLFERKERKGISYTTVHLGADGDADDCYGYGSKASVRNHEYADIMARFVGDFKVEAGVVKPVPPMYEKLVSFYVDSNLFTTIKSRYEADAAGKVKFSFIADLWSENNYNCCSYAHRLLKECGIIFECTRETYFLFFHVITDNSFIESLIRHANAKKAFIHPGSASTIKERLRLT